MAKKTTLVIDTNSYRSDAGQYDQFFGYRDELNKLKSTAKIVIPRVVVDEISAQKRRALQRKQSEHISNPFLKISGVSPEDIKKIDVSQIIDTLFDSETANFVIRELRDEAEALRKIYRWAIDKHPPFSPEEKVGDKGFKDAYIACIIDELLDEAENDYIVFLTKDNLLKQAFDDKPRVKIVSEFDEVASYIIDTFLDEYMVKKIQEELEIEDLIVIDNWQNLDENWVIKTDEGEESRLVVIDSRAREIVDTCSDNNEFFLAMLTDSRSFEQTHNAVSELTAIFPFLRMRELEELILAGVTNDQIYQIAKDEDVQQFYMQAYQVIADRLDAEIIIKFKEYFK